MVRPVQQAHKVGHPFCAEPWTRPRGITSAWTAKTGFHDSVDHMCRMAPIAHPAFPGLHHCSAPCHYACSTHPGEPFPARAAMSTMTKPTSRPTHAPISSIGTNTPAAPGRIRVRVCACGSRARTMSWGSLGKKACPRSSRARACATVDASGNALI